MGHKQPGYNGEAAWLFVSQPACGRHNFFVRWHAHLYHQLGYLFLKKIPTYCCLEKPIKRENKAPSTAYVTTNILVRPIQNHINHILPFACSLTESSLSISRIWLNHWAYCQIGKADVAIQHQTKNNPNMPYLNLRLRGLFDFKLTPNT